MPVRKKDFLMNRPRIKRVSLRRNIIKCIFYLIALAFLMWVYYKWQSIPIRKHVFQVEYLASTGKSAKIRAVFEIEDSKTLDLNKEFRKSWQIQKQDSTYDYYLEECNITNINANEIAFPKKPFSKNLFKYIKLSLRDEIIDTCINNSIDTSKYDNLFFYRHLDNEKNRRTCKIKHKITRPGCYNELFVIEKNEFVLLDFPMEKSLGINTPGYENKEINRNTLAQSEYEFRNVTQAIVLSPAYQGQCQWLFDYHARTTVDIPKKSTRFLIYLFTLEDISQSYYLIKMRSRTIPELSLVIDFIGTIECIYDKETIKYNNYTEIDVDRSTIILSRKNGKADSNMFALVKFNDMQNLQKIRLFILAAFITLLLTRLLRIIGEVVWERIQANKHVDNNSNQVNGIAFNDMSQESDDDIPEFYL